MSDYTPTDGRAKPTEAPQRVTVQDLRRVEERPTFRRSDASQTSLTAPRIPDGHPIVDLSLASSECPTRSSDTSPHSRNPRTEPPQLLSHVHVRTRCLSKGRSNTTIRHRDELMVALGRGTQGAVTRCEIRQKLIQINGHQPVRHPGAGEWPRTAGVADGSGLCQLKPVGLESRDGRAGDETRRRLGVTADVPAGFLEDVTKCHNAIRHCDESVTNGGGGGHRNGSGRSRDLTAGGRPFDRRPWADALLRTNDNGTRALSRTDDFTT